MRICESHSLCAEFVDVRRRDLSTPGVVALHIAVAEVVGEDDENIGIRCVGAMAAGGYAE